MFSQTGHICSLLPVNGQIEEKTERERERGEGQRDGGKGERRRRGQERVLERESERGMTLG